MTVLSTNLVRMIESHAEQITSEAVQHIRRDPELPNLKKLPDPELRSWATHILKHLGDWLGATDEKQIASCYEGLGRLRFEEHVPLHESIRNFQMLKNLIVGYVRIQGPRQTTVEVYAGGELEHLLSQFFDKMVYHVVRGYESAQRYGQVATR